MNSILPFGLVLENGDQEKFFDQDSSEENEVFRKIFKEDEKDAKSVLKTCKRVLLKEEKKKKGKRKKKLTKKEDLVAKRLAEKEMNQKRMEEVEKENMKKRKEYLVKSKELQKENFLLKQYFGMQNKQIYKKFIKPKKIEIAAAYTYNLRERLHTLQPGMLNKHEENKKYPWGKGKPFPEKDDRNLLYFHLSRCLTMIKRHEFSWPFLEPVDPFYVADYFDYIKTPIDLSTMEQKLKGRIYVSKSEFCADLDLLFSNCRSYNAGENNYYRYLGNTLEQFCHRLMETVPDKIHDTKKIIRLLKKKGQRKKKKHKKINNRIIDFEEDDGPQSEEEKKRKRKLKDLEEKRTIFFEKIEKSENIDNLNFDIIEPRSAKLMGYYFLENGEYMTKDFQEQESKIAEEIGFPEFTNKEKFKDKELIKEKKDRVLFLNSSVPRLQNDYLNNQFTFQNGCVTMMNNKIVNNQLKKLKDKDYWQFNALKDETKNCKTINNNIKQLYHIRKFVERENMRKITKASNVQPSLSTLSPRSSNNPLKESPIAFTPFTPLSPLTPVTPGYSRLPFSPQSPRSSLKSPTKPHYFDSIKKHKNQPLVITSAAKAYDLTGICIAQLLMHQGFTNISKDALYILIEVLQQFFERFGSILNNRLTFNTSSLSLNSLILQTLEAIGMDPISIFEDVKSNVINTKKNLQMVTKKLNQRKRKRNQLEEKKRIEFEQQQKKRKLMEQQTQLLQQRIGGQFGMNYRLPVPPFVRTQIVRPHLMKPQVLNPVMLNKIQTAQLHAVNTTKPPFLKKVIK